MNRTTDTALAYALVVLAVVTGAVWAGAQTAGLLHSGTGFVTTPADTLAAAIQLPAHASDPANAWPTHIAERLPGPAIYWTTTLVAFAVIGTVAVWAAIKLNPSRPGTTRADRLGVSPHARMATRRDLKPLIVSGPTSGRFILGRVGRRYVATETRHQPTPRIQDRLHKQQRAGDRSAVIIVGPSRCGKTANVTAGVTDWDGPAILSSVKDDLFHNTITHRLNRGHVYVFDPFHQLHDIPDGVTKVGWSPLQSSLSISGAQQTAATLLDAGPTEGVTNANYWTTKGQQLIWPILYAAAINSNNMADVVRWLTLQDGNREDHSTVGEILRNAAAIEQLSDVVSAGATEARSALDAFRGFWRLDDRTRSDIFSTAQTVLTAWEDPNIAAASALKPHMTLKQILDGEGTLYLIQPLKSVERFAVVFGGLLVALLRDEAYDLANEAGQPITPTLAVIDEAGNTPIRWLPDVASTCSGIGIQLVTVWQSLAQARAIYQNQTDALLTNHGTKIFFSGLSDRTTLDYASHLTGDEEVNQTSTTRAVGGNERQSIATSVTRQRLLPPDLLRQIPLGTALLLHGTLPPAHLVGRRPWEENVATGRKRP